MNSRDIQPFHTSEDYARALAVLQQNVPVTREYLFGIIGETATGRTVFFPSSFRKGYFDALLPLSSRPYYVFDLLIIGKLSDDTWVFPPSYNDGLQTGINDLKFAILAEGQKRLYRKLEEMEAQLKDLQEKPSKLSEDKEEKD